MYYAELFSEALAQPPNAIAYYVSRQLASLFPNRAILEGADCDFRLEAFARAGHCNLVPDTAAHSQFSTRWSCDKGVVHEAANAWFECEWEDHNLDILLMNWEDCYQTQFWIVAESRAVAERFFATVCAWQPALHEEILVFEDGYWTTSKTLFREIEHASYDDLILADSLKEEILADLRRFFDSRSTYERYGIPWRRGVLFTGPPGNGKTHAIKALIRALGRPGLYVKSFSAERMIDTTNIRRVYARARRMAPCLVVLEDLDSLVDDASRSFFLNELDGFAANSGIVTLATTNHPDKLDGAILDRPSRFDRRYDFALPGPAECRLYLERWSSALHDDLRLSEAGLDQATALTEGFSFAYLKELCLSALMAWINQPAPGDLNRVMAEQAATLARQVLNAGCKVPR